MSELAAAPPLTAPARALAWFCWIGGGLARLVYVWVLHPPTQHVYSDMQGYVERAQRWAASAPETIADTLYPPGAAWWFGFWYRLDPSWALAGLAQWLVALGVLGLTALIARRLYGNGAMLAALFVAAFYPPLIHYPALFLAENPFCGVVLLTVYCALRVLSSSGWRALVWAGAAGLGIGAGMALKNTMVPAVLMVVIAWAIQTPVARWRLRPASVTGFVALLALVRLAMRCTALSGDVCLVANNLGMNVLMGHNGAVGEYRWHDGARGIVMYFTAVENNARGYTASVDLPFGPYDNRANLQLAWDWMAAHPAAALTASLGHVYNSFVSGNLWPMMKLGAISGAAITQTWFILLVLVPALARLCRGASEDALGANASGARMLLLAPVAGVALSVFVSIGESRFRVPFDPLLIIYAAPGLAQTRHLSRKALRLLRPR